MSKLKEGIAFSQVATQYSEDKARNGVSRVLIYYLFLCSDRVKYRGSVQITPN